MAWRARPPPSRVGDSGFGSAGASFSMGPCDMKEFVTPCIVVSGCQSWHGHLARGPEHDPVAASASPSTLLGALTHSTPAQGHPEPAERMSLSNGRVDLSVPASVEIRRLRSKRIGMNRGLHEPRITQITRMDRQDVDGRLPPNHALGDDFELWGCSVHRS